MAGKAARSIRLPAKTTLPHDETWEKEGIAIQDELNKLPTPSMKFDLSYDASETSPDVKMHSLDHVFSPSPSPPPKLPRPSLPKESPPFSPLFPPSALPSQSYSSHPLSTDNQPFDRATSNDSSSMAPAMKPTKYNQPFISPSRKQ